MRKTTLFIMMMIAALAAVPLFALDFSPLDKYIQTTMEENNIPGAVVSVVYRGETTLLKAYGTTDVETGEAVAPETSRFRIGSVTKLFTYTSLMQLADQGLINLDSPVEDYIDFELPNKYGRKIIVADLFNHTAGFEEVVYNIQERNPEDVEDLESWVKENIPSQVKDPGSYVVYSNYGVTLMGYIIETLSGLTYADYVRENILVPLKMENTTITAVESLATPGLTGCYDIVNGTPVTAETGYWNVGPAGSITSTGKDMAAFMQAHLGKSGDEGVKLMEQITLERMHQTSFSSWPEFCGMANGFIEGTYKGYDYIWHGGSTVYNLSNLLLFPDLELGVFISTNSNTGGTLTGNIGAKIVELLLPEREYEVPEEWTGSVDFSRFAGVYHLNRSNYTTSEKLTRLQGSSIVYGNEDHLLLAGTYKFTPVGPLLFHNAETGLRILFEEDEKGRITGYLTSDAPIFSHEKQLGLNNVFFHIGLFLIIILFCLISGLIRLIKIILKRRTVDITFILKIMITLSGVGITTAFFTTTLNNIMFAEVGFISAALWFSPLVAAAAALTLFALIRRLVGKQDGDRVRIDDWLTGTSGLLYTAFLIYWNAIIPIF